MVEVDDRPDFPGIVKLLESSNADAASVHDGQRLSIESDVFQELVNEGNPQALATTQEQEEKHGLYDDPIM